jgi:hypothetical protein
MFSVSSVQLRDDEDGGRAVGEVCTLLPDAAVVNVADFLASNAATSEVDKFLLDWLRLTDAYEVLITRRPLCQTV